MCRKIHSVALGFGGGHNLKSGNKSHVKVLPWDQCDGRSQSVSESSPISALRQAVDRCVQDPGSLGNRELRSVLSSVAFHLLAECRESPQTIWKLLCHANGPCLRSSKWISNSYEGFVHVSVWGSVVCFCYCIHVGLHTLSSSMPSPSKRLPIYAHSRKKDRR
jgi:hypothetical protein